jgi:propanediol dehydratase large subunit
LWADSALGGDGGVLHRSAGLGWAFALSSLAWFAAVALFLSSAVGRYQGLRDFALEQEQVIDTTRKSLAGMTENTDQVWVQAAVEINEQPISANLT